MRKLRNLSIIGLITVLIYMFGCNKNRIFHEVKKFDDYKWNKTERLDFEFTIEQPYIAYELWLNLRYIQGFPYKYLHLLVTITEPDGKIKTNELTIQIISDDKKYIGDGAGSYWDLDYPIPDYKFNQKGKYKITIEHAMKENILTPIGEVGLTVNKSKE